MIGPQCHHFWVTHPIDAFKGAPLWFGCWMSCKRFNLILGGLAFTDKNLPAFADPFWEAQQMIDAWQTNTNAIFSPGFMNCLDVHEHLDKQVHMSRVHVCPKQAMAIWE